MKTDSFQRATIEPPITCVYEEDSEVRVFPTLSDAEGAVEGVDIQGGDVAYDRNGLLLNFKISGVSKFHGTVTPGTTKLYRAEDRPSHMQDLTNHLRRHFLYLSSLAHVDVSESWARHASVDEMLARGVAFEKDNLRSAKRLMLVCLGVALFLLGVGLTIWIR